MAEEAIIKIIVEGGGGQTIPQSGGGAVAGLGSGLAGSGLLIKGIVTGATAEQKHPISEIIRKISNWDAIVSLIEPSQSQLQRRGSILIGDLAAAKQNKFELFGQGKIYPSLEQYQLLRAKIGLLPPQAATRFASLAQAFTPEFQSTSFSSLNISPLGA